MADLTELGKKAKAASVRMSVLSTDEKNRGLYAMAEALVDSAGEIISANSADMKRAEDKGTSQAMLDRLVLTEKKIADMAEGIKQVAELEDPIGSLIETITRPNGLVIEKRRVPLGVIGIIYESRPNVTADAAALCFKSGNACILRGGSDAINSNMAITEVLRRALKNTDLPKDAISLIEDTSHESVNELMRMKDYVDLLIPRGGAGLIRSVVENSKVPVIETGVGNCHIYIDASADKDMAVDIIVNAKTQRMGVCNAAESLVIHKDAAERILPEIYSALSEKGITLHGDPLSTKIMKAYAGETGENVIPATPEDYGTEYLGPEISVKVVDTLDEAITHVNRYTTHHSEAIVTKNEESGNRFLREVDAACVYVNASTRFTDGFEFGFGAEIGISTQKFHARGPMGLEALTSYKYEIRGTGQIRG